MRRGLAGALAALLLGIAVTSSGAGVMPAFAAEGASLLLVKTVNGADAARDLRPGDSVTYRVEFRVNDEDADAPVLVVDSLPAAFAGWQISGLTAVVGGSPANVTLDLPGITTGPAPSSAVGGTLGSTADDLVITVGIAEPVQAGAGNDSGLGMSTRNTGVLEYTITVPGTLSPLDPILRTDLINTADFTAKAGVVELAVDDSAIISVDNPIAVDVTPSKSWSPDSQLFQPGQGSTITIGATQASNVPASALRLQDPADPALAPDGAASLPAGNPFNHVDFTGFTAPADPSSNLPDGATAASVEIYRLSGGSWSWTAWDASIPNDEIAGVRTSYTGSIPPGTSVSQGFGVEQRATHRSMGTSISTGYDLTNEVRATVEVPAQPSVSKDADADFAVTPERIDVTAQKGFYTLPSGTPVTNLTGVTAGDTIGVVLRAINGEAPQSTTLDRLVIAEPGTGSNARFFGDELSFAGFDNSDLDSIWPSGASSAELRWEHPGGPTTVLLAAGDPLPAAPAGVTGFELAFIGAIAPGAYSEIRYELLTSSDEDFVPAGATAGPFRNTIDVTGQRENLPDESETAHADITLVAPRIDVSIDKRVGPGSVLPGQDVVVQLDTSAQTAGGRTKPVEIVVEDAYSGPGTFWDAFDATAVLAPISRPFNSGSPATQADLTIQIRDAAGDWSTLVVNPDEHLSVPVPAGATGLRFVYTNDDGFSQISYVKPNIAFTARTVLRSDAGTPTASAFEAEQLYENLATAEATGMLDSRTVIGDDEDREDVGIRGTDGGPGVGGLWADKIWAHDALTSQSGASSWTTQYWTVSQSGYETVRLQDPAAPTATGAGTVFEAFDLTHIRPIRFSDPAGNGTVDPLLRWDLVTDVQLWDGSSWSSVPAPGGGWMDANGFKGHVLTTAQQQSTLGVRLVLSENTAARQAAADAGDLTAPAVGSGVAASADIRSFRLDWQLRERARTADASLKWVKEQGTVFNCADAATGCIDNVFGVTGVTAGGDESGATANDTIQLIDGVTNVILGKQVSLLDPVSGNPVAAPADSVDMIVPNPGELGQVHLPRARYTLSASNSSTAPDGSRGAMRLGKIRVTDTSSHQLDPAPVLDMATSPFAGRDFAVEVSGPEGNHFDEFTLTGVSFGALPSTIDTGWSTVELWVYDGTDPAGDILEFTLQEVLDGDAAFIAALPQAIGIAVTYSGTDPEANGNRIAVGESLVMHLDVQLRATHRLSGDPVEGGGAELLVTVPNEARTLGWDAVVSPAAMPGDTDEASIGLMSARVLVDLVKQIAVDHGGSSNQTIYESDPQAPVNVLLTAYPDGSTAPLNTLRIEDRTAAFWDHFEFLGFGTPAHPTNADDALLEVLVNGIWVPHTAGIDSAEVRGVAVTFSRSDAALFPLGTTSWSASWSSATLPFTVQLREGAVIDWDEGLVENTASVLANNTLYGQASTDADEEIDFSRGIHSIEVIKRAPNDTSTHQVEALASMPWRLVFTNTGNSYLPIERVVDAMPTELHWDGEQPVFTSAPGSSGISGLSSDAADVAVTLSPDGRSLVFEWPEGSRMQPGESMTIALGMILQPLPTGQRAVNEVVVETGVPLATCTQPNNFGQAPQPPAAEGECSNTNFVQPRAGTVIGAVKTVRGEPSATLGEDLVTGALDVRTGEECSLGSFRPIGSEYTRNPCASYTAVGATDTWKLEHINSGTEPLSRMTIIDMMPYPGDKMLAGGAARGSTFRPVLLGETAAEIFTLTGLPAGASFTVDVTTDPAACVGPAPGSSLWVADPECTDTAANPANASWTSLSDHLLTGTAEDIAGFRIRVDMSAQPLLPAGNVIVEFETANRVIENAADGLQPTLAQYATPQFAWNQNGVIAWDTTGTRVNLPAAPQRAGVTVKTGELVVSKEVLGDGAANAPDFFPVELVCTVPSGVADPERVPLDLGAHASIMVPKNGSVSVPGLPIGTDCTASEAGEVGAHGESGRSIETAPGVSPASDGLSASIQIRQRDGDETLLGMRNTFTLGEMLVEKAVSSSTEFAPGMKELETVFEFELVCQANGMSDEIRRSFQLSAGQQHREAELPVGAECILTETSSGGAELTTITVAGDESEGATRDDLVVLALGVHVLVSNVFEVPEPGEVLSMTGGTFTGMPLLLALALLASGTAVLWLRRRRPEEG